MQVLRFDQFHASATNLNDLGLSDFENPREGIVKLKGGDSESATAIFGIGSTKIIEVLPTDKPGIGDFWFTENPVSHKLEYYRSNPDTSD